MAATGGPTTDLERYLETADVILRATHAMGGGGHPNSFLGVLVGGVGVLVKPSDSTADAAKMIRREVAAWRLAAALGWPDLVAATVLREVESLQTGDRIEASAQVIWPSTQPGVAVDSFSDDDIWRAAVLDALIRQTDRNPTNWLAVPQDPSHGLQRLKLIDHGYAFDLTRGLDLSVCPFVAHVHQQEIPGYCQEAIEELAGHVGVVRDLLEADEYEAFVERTEKLRGGVLDI